MRKYLILLIFFCSIAKLGAQVNPNDSLRNLLAQAKDDAIKAKLLLRLSGNFIYSRADSALIYAEEALKLSRQVRDPKIEIDALGAVSDAYTLAGDYSTALRNAIEGLKKAEQVNDSGLIWRGLWGISTTYNHKGDEERSLQYMMKVKDILKNTGDQGALTGALINIGYTYYTLNKLDSARIFINQSLEISLRRTDEEHIGACYLNLGMIYSRMKLYDLAKNYLRLSLPYFSLDNYYFISAVHGVLAEVFDSTGEKDSSFYYARKSYRMAKQLGAPDNILPPAQQLVSLFRKSGRADSALFYQDMVVQLKDSVSSADKQKQIESLTFREQLRQMDLANEKLRQKEQLTRNLQTAGVALFIPIFFGLVLIMSRKQIRPRAVEFLGTLFLLFVFEFITLFAHPFVSKWTRESQIWMLLIFVGVAMILVPLHHRSENWLKKQLVIQRRQALQKRIRLGQEAQKKLES